MPNQKNNGYNTTELSVGSEIRGNQEKTKTQNKKHNFCAKKRETYQNVPTTLEEVGQNT